MKYTITNTQISSEVVIDADNYSADIIMDIQPKSDLLPLFSKTLTVVSNNKQTGFEVDDQRAEAIKDYLNQINK